MATEISPTISPDEEVKRLATLHYYRILDTLPEATFNGVAQLAANICNTPIALISLVDSDRQWFKARVGLEISETPRCVAFCAHAIMSDEPFIIEDATKDERFTENSLVLGEPYVRFYAGVPLIASTGARIGTVCVIDTTPRTINSTQLESLKILAAQTVSLLELRLRAIERDELSQKALRAEVDNRAIIAHKAALLDLAFHGANLGLWDWNFESNETFFNDVWYTMLGYEPGELPMHLDTWKSLCHPDDLKQAMLTLDAYLRGETTIYRCVQKLKRKDGTWMWIEDVGKVCEWNSDGTPHRIVGVHIDVDRLKRSEEAARAATDAKSRFLALMSHEIRTPMNGITTATSLLRETALSAEQHELAETVQTSSEVLLRIVNDVLDFSKIEAGKMTISPAPTNLRSLIQTLERLYSHQAVQKDISLVVEVATSVPEQLMLDGARLQQILMNLLGNAFKFSSDGGGIVLAIQNVASKGEHCELNFAVSDTGIGIPSEAQRKIFEAFEQADGTVSRHYGGTGLGLSIASRLVAVMGGTLELQSAPGKGTLFQFTIPARITSAVTSPSTTTPKRSDHRPLSILMAEDNEVNQKLTVRILEKAGHSVTIARNGLEALNLFEREPFDLILMDIEMPELGGIETTARLRAHQRGKSVPIVALTANAFESDRERYLQAGMDDFVAKPLNRTLLFEAMERAFLKHRCINE